MFYAQQQCVYAASQQSRCIVAQVASKERHRWVLGSFTLGADNEVSVIEFDEETGNLECVAQYAQGEKKIWSMETSPKDSSLLVTSYQDKSLNNGVSLCKMPGQTLQEIESNRGEGNTLMSGEKMDLEVLQDIEKTGAEKRDPSYTTSVKWSTLGDQLITAKASTISVHTIGASNSSGGDSGSLDFRLDPSYEVSKTKAQKEIYSAASWDPHSPNSAAAVCDSYLYTLDTRSMSIGTKVYAHKGTTRGVDYNPNKPHAVITSGDDRRVRFWDTRNMKQPVKTLLGHEHWVWTAKYNPFHDQLVLSGGADNNVNLWRVASCSSSPWLGGGIDDDSEKDENSERRSLMSERSGKEGALTDQTSETGASEDSQSMDPPDVLIKALNQHTDTVYSVAWSPADAWVYCSMSLDGRVYLNHVPAAEKYKLLL